MSHVNDTQASLSMSKTCRPKEILNLWVGLVLMIIRIRTYLAMLRLTYHTHPTVWWSWHSFSFKYLADVFPCSDDDNDDNQPRSKSLDESIKEAVDAAKR